MVYSSGVSDNIISLSKSGSTVASALSKAPEQACHKVWLELYPKPFVLKRIYQRFAIKHDLYYGRGDPTQDDLDRAAQCGNFPYRPSDLFLKVSCEDGALSVQSEADSMHVSATPDHATFSARPLQQRCSRTYCYVLKEIQWLVYVHHHYWERAESCLCPLYLCKHRNLMTFAFTFS
jgi:hypothetical protein